MSCPPETWSSPATGAALIADTPHSLAAAKGFGGERWPVVDGIPYLRTGRAALVEAALGRLDAGDADGALVLLLADQDDWWTGPATDPSELRQLVAGRDTLSLREAMALLRLGPVADYFAYRWVDPTFLAGLALLEAHWNAPATAFELACGIGHYLRELTRRGVACTGADVVFAKCWLAKHWVAPDADYVVFDAGAEHWPVAQARFDLVQCHDAFYFMPRQGHVAAMLRNMTAADGVLAVSHIHNLNYWAGSRGPARTAAEWHRMFPDALVYDEDELVWTGLRGMEAPEASGWIDNPDVEAFSAIEGWMGPARVPAEGMAVPIPGAPLRANPLLGDVAGHDRARWPSDRWRDEYGRNCWWANPDDEGPGGGDDVRRRRVVDLPARW